MTISDAEIALQRRAARLVEREVHACMSSLVATLCGVGGMSQSALDADRAAWELFNAAVALAAPVLDYEGAAREAGFTPDDSSNWSSRTKDASYGSAEDACNDWDIEPHEIEVYEHWAVSPWLAEKLDAKGERVDTDFAGLNVWARTTTGQAISADGVIEAITAETGYASVPGPDMLDGEA